MSENTDIKDKSIDDILIAAIGASAGGLESLKIFLEKMIPHENLALVIVQHLSPKFKSLMASILSKHTSMPVNEAEEGMVIKPKHVYIIPPKKNMVVKEGKLFLEDRVNKPNLNLSIDIFFEYLAKYKKEKSIGIIFSGAGTDGTRGCSAIKKTGGMVIVQNEQSAKFDSMPSSVISSGLYDAILPPDKIPEMLYKYISQSLLDNYTNSQRNVVEDYQDILNEIYSIFRKFYSVDFSCYKQKSIIRNIERRMRICGFNLFNDYLKYVQDNSDEIELLYKNLLIGVTSFFRDEKAFDILKEQILPEIVAEKKQKESIRIWVAGCSTGEEVYSIAIIINEFMEKNEINKRLKIFATDVNTDALEFASLGIYDKSIASEVSQKRLEKYFIKTKGYYQITKEIRDSIIFSRHNIISDPPFSQIDMLCCRNMLIYLNTDVQSRILSFFQFAVKVNGFLFLGSSEPTNELRDYFTPVSNKWKIFRRNKTYKRPPIINNFSPVSPENVYPKKLLKLSAKTVREEKNEHNEITSRIIKEFVPPCIVIDNNDEIVEIYGNANRFLELPSGRANLNILKLTPQIISIALGLAINKARKENTSVTYRDVKPEIFMDGGIDFTVKPFNTKSNNDLVIIVFHSSEVAATNTAEHIEQFEINSTAKERILDLEEELEETKRLLQSTLEDVEASSEELQSTNEELTASNEELQSTNEEMHSINEELITVNTQYLSKIDELTELNNDLNNFLTSTNIGIVFLDKDLCIRKFSPTIKKEINIIETDIGRPINHISHKLNNLDLCYESKSVINKLASKTIEVDSFNKKKYMFRFLPYMTPKGEVDGVIINMVDITEFKNTVNELRKLSHAIEQTSAGVIITDNKGKMEYVNSNLTELTGYSKEEILGESINILRHKDEGSKLEKIMEIIKEKGRWKGELLNVKKNGDLHWVSTTISPVKDKEGNVTNYIAIKEDVTENRNMIKKIKRSEEKFRKLFEGAKHAAFIFEAGGSFLGNLFEVNDYTCKILGYTREELLNMDIYSFILEQDIKKLEHVFEQLGTEEITSVEMTFVAKNKAKIPVEINFQNVSISNLKVVMAIALDITKRKQAEEYKKKIEEDEKLLKEAEEFERLRTEFFANLSHELRTPLNIILGNLQLMQKNIYKSENNDKKIIKRMDSMKLNCYRLLRMLNNLIDITKIDAGYYNVEMESYDIVSLVENITISVADFAEEKFITIIFDTDIEEKHIVCNPDSIERIILNILSNAIKFTSPKGMINVSIENKKTDVVISVKDTGIGIPEDKLSVIFERFMQVDKSLTRSNEGSGIGLSLVKSLIEMHDGIIDAKSIYGEGTEFIITLPVKDVNKYTKEQRNIERRFVAGNNRTQKDQRIEKLKIEFSDIYPN